jgi:hypothetical protein
MYANPYGFNVSNVAGMPSTHFWNLYSVDLGATTGANSWTSRSNWKGLRIDPTNLNNEANANFSVDWVRLTDCSIRTYHAVWSTSLTSGSIWAQPSGTNRKIRIATDVTGTSKDLDLQGMQPGTYDLFTGPNNDNYNSTSFGSVIVNQTPIVSVTKPSFTSGYSYGTQIGNPWDMSDSQDGRTECTSSNYSNGFLNLNTATGASQPSNCVNGGIADPKVYLNSPQQVNTSDYRYFSFRMYTEGNWQKFGKGMMARFIWVSNNLSMVSRDIPYDVGWNTLTIDLNDPYAGVPMECSPISPCPGGTNWLNSKTAGTFRFDPNENISGANYLQQIDWVSLTKVDEVKRGIRFPIGIQTVKSSGSMNLTYYYTSSLSNPKQNVAKITTPGTTTPPRGTHQVFIPTITKN